MNKASLYISILSLVLSLGIGLNLLVTNCKKDTCNQSEQQEKENIVNVKKEHGIVFYRSDRIIKEYDMALELHKLGEAKIQGINDEVTRRKNLLEKEMLAFQEKVSKGLLTRSVAEIQGQKLGEKQIEYQNYAQKKQDEINEELTVMNNQIADAVQQFLVKYNAVKGYSLIIATQGDILPLPISIGDPDLDITDDLVSSLNAEYAKEKKKK